MNPENREIKKEISIWKNPEFKEIMDENPELIALSELFWKIDEKSDNLYFLSNIFEKVKLSEKTTNDLDDLKTTINIA